MIAIQPHCFIVLCHRQAETNAQTKGITLFASRSTFFHPPKAGDALFSGRGGATRNL